MVAITKPLQDKLEFVKNPVIAEFLGVKQDASFTEEKLEFASKYKLCLPKEEDLRKEIEAQKQIFIEQHGEAK